MFCFVFHKVIENLNLKIMITSLCKLLLWPNFQGTPLIKQDADYWEQTAGVGPLKRTCVMYMMGGLCLEVMFLAGLISLCE